jgi:hypothetical protein
VVIELLWNFIHNSDIALALDSLLAIETVQNFEKHEKTLREKENFKDHVSEQMG